MQLGDSSPSAVGAQREPTRPWSWKVYAYKKKQVCSSELYFLRPAFARDTRGESLSQARDLSSDQVHMSQCHFIMSLCHIVPILLSAGIFKNSYCLFYKNHAMRRTQRPAAAANTNLETLSRGADLGTLSLTCACYTIGLLQARGTLWCRRRGSSSVWRWTCATTRTCPAPASRTAAGSPAVSKDTTTSCCSLSPPATPPPPPSHRPARQSLGIVLEPQWSSFSSRKFYTV